MKLRRRFVSALAYAVASSAMGLPALAGDAHDPTRAAGFQAVALELIDDLGTPTRRFDRPAGPAAGDGDGAEGDVRAPLLYVNHGLDADYARLANNRLSARGRIVIVRDGAQFRGLLAERAQRNGAVALIFYSDPRDGGSAWRPATTAQRGMVSRLSLKIPAVPVTAATADALLYASARGERAHLVVRLERRVGPA